MKKKLFSSLAIASAAIAGVVTPTCCLLTSCSSGNDNPDAKTHNVKLRGSRAVIDKTVAREGENFTATITSSLNIVKVTNVYINNQPITLDLYSYEVINDGINCNVAINKDVIKGDIIIEVATRPNTNDLLFSITDDIDNKGIIIADGDEWVDKETAYSGNQFTFYSDYLITESYPEYDPDPEREPGEPDKIWKQCINVECGDHWLSPGAYYLEVDSTYTKYTITFLPGYITSDVTIHVKRLISIWKQEEAEKMFYMNPDYDDTTITPFCYIRGTKVKAIGWYDGSLAPGQKLSYSGIDVFVGNNKLDAQDYEWQQIPDKSGLYTVSVVVYSDVALDDIRFSAKYTIA